LGFTTYQLLIDVARPLPRTIGALGEFDFPAGCYVYTGSAKQNFEARVARHLRKEKTLRWHIDYLLTAPEVAVLDVRRTTEPECKLNQNAGGKVLIPGFGASDCRAGCGSHLRYFGAWL
jgi:Uri superfamily endonuclease